MMKLDNEQLGACLAGVWKSLEGGMSYRRQLLRHTYMRAFTALDMSRESFNTMRYFYVARCRKPRSLDFRSDIS